MVEVDLKELQQATANRNWMEYKGPRVYHFTMIPISAHTSETIKLLAFYNQKAKHYAWVEPKGLFCDLGVERINKNLLCSSALWVATNQGKTKAGIVTSSTNQYLTKKSSCTVQTVYVYPKRLTAWEETQLRVQAAMLKDKLKKDLKELDEFRNYLKWWEKNQPLLERLYSPPSSGRTRQGDLPYGFYYPKDENEQPARPEVFYNP